MDNTAKLLLEQLGVRFPTKLPYPAQPKTVGTINGFWIHFNNYYFVLKGKFPAEHARIIYREVSQRLEIRADGHGCNIDPEDHFTSDEWESLSSARVAYWLSNKDCDYKVLNEELNRDRKALMEKDISKFYLEMYHIDIVEGIAHMVKYIKDHGFVTTW